MPLRKLQRKFFQQPADVVARELIGKIIVRNLTDDAHGNAIQRRARIVEAEAYMGPVDLASHSSKGRTRRTEVMFGPAGHAYVYLIYGMHQMLNVVAGRTGEAHAVLLRAAEPLDDWQADLRGPGKLARHLEIARDQYGADLTGDMLYFLDNLADRPTITVTRRVGVDYAGQWKDAMLRFFETGNRAVSRPWR